MGRSYLWQLGQPGVKRCKWLDPSGAYQLVVSDKRHIEVARVRVFSADDEIRLADQLWDWFNADCPEHLRPLPHPPSDPCHRRRRLGM